MDGGGLVGGHMVEGIHPRRVVSPDVLAGWLKLAPHVSPSAASYLRSLANRTRGQGVPLFSLPWHETQAHAPVHGAPVFQPHDSVLDCLLGSSIPLRAIWQRGGRAGA